MFLECVQIGNMTKSSWSHFLVEFYKSPYRVPSLLAVPSIANLIKVHWLGWPMQPP